jgi:hypothetical protein
LQLELPSFAGGFAEKKKTSAFTCGGHTLTPAMLAFAELLSPEIHAVPTLEPSPIGFIEGR